MFQKLSILIDTVRALKLSLEEIQKDTTVLKSVQDLINPIEPLVNEIEAIYKEYPGDVKNEQIIVDSINLLRAIRAIVIEGRKMKKEEPPKPAAGKKSIFSFFSSTPSPPAPVVEENKAPPEEYVSRVNEKKTELESLVTVIKTNNDSSTL